MLPAILQARNLHGAFRKNPAIIRISLFAARLFFYKTCFCRFTPLAMDNFKQI